MQIVFVQITSNMQPAAEVTFIVLIVNELVSRCQGEIDAIPFDENSFVCADSVTESCS